MRTTRQSIAEGFFAATWATLLLLFVTNARAAERQIVRGHVVKAIAELNLQPLGRLPSSSNLDLAVSLPLRNQEALTNLLQQQYAPTSPQYHHWLTPEQFTARFGPTEQDYQAVIEFAKSNGFTVTGTHSSRTLVDVRGSVGDIERTFRVTLLTYQHPTEAREFYAPDAEPSLDLTVPILHITGLDSYTLPRPLSIQQPAENIGANATPADGSGPSGSYRGQDFRAAYVPGVSLTGTGQVVALVEFDGYYANDITEYESQAGLPNVTLTNVLVDGFSGVPTADAGQVREVSLDIEMAISMAPGLSAVVVYEAPNEPAFDIDVLDRIATDNLAKQISCSWNIADSTTFDQEYQKCAAQGRSFFKSSGDNGAFTFLWPNQQQADSPYVTLVGGTTLTTTGPEGAWQSESVWNFNTGTGLGETNDASGGGISTTYTIPLWQQGIDMTSNQGSTIMRNVPDVAMVASGIYVIYNNGSTASNIGGTSCAAPLWAGFTALVNQQAANYGEPTVGFINPAIYAIGTGTMYAACFHDITNGNNETYHSPFQFSATNGYDLCTGWGTPTGSNLVNALAPQPASDLTRGSDSLDDSSPPAGGMVTVSITITNQPCPGGGTAAGPFHVGFYGLTTDSSFTGVSAFYETPVSGCADGGSVPISQNITIDSTTTPGTYYLGYKIDDLNEVTECNETDKGMFYWTVTVLPPGQFTYTFNNTPLWDLSGIYTNIDTSSGTDTVIVTLQQQASGLITGDRNETDVNDTGFAEGSGPATGKVFVRAGTVGASLKYSGEFTGESGGVAIAGNYAIKETDAIVPSSLTLFCSDSFRTCRVGSKCETQTSSDTIPLPAGMNGDWALGLNIATNGTKLAGTGTLTLSNGRVLTYQVTGSFNNRNQTSKLKFIGESDALGTSLSLSTIGTNLVTLKGKVLGQSLKYP
ncbi:MAG: protease pro-enzyme activation domain-containing protein [Verrucomicrobiia bacterium]